MAINESEIDKLAALSRVKVGQEDKRELLKDMESILDYVSELQKAPGLTEEHLPENYYLRNVMREDNEPFASGINTETILSQAPKRKDNYFVVKKILGDSIS